MNVKEVHTRGNEYGEGEYYSLFVDGEYALSAGNGESEDNILGRDLSFVLNIPNLLKMAYDAGVAGEPFKIVSEEEE